MNISQEYIGAIAILIVSVLKAFKIDLGPDVVSNVIVAVIAVWVAIRRHQKGDITLAGTRK